ETADCRLGESIVASTWPAVTCWPAWTFTAVTVPAAAKLRSSVWAAAPVPSADTVFVRLPRVTVTSWCVVVVATAVEPSPEDRKPKHQTPNATTTTMGPAIQGRRRRSHHSARRERALPGCGVAGDGAGSSS